eukprot:TRINITY_DN8045_c0_g1_i1.p1 TRINITY_DN8045_c0_g1~~TRINITY_DN8045_c0_g1_i1.p1  ORF type:complete len:637 (+),score=91.43 TRINITY_DN8045_c0_g1_i1:123-2033(+)
MTRFVSRDELAAHSLDGDMWLAIDHKVYDVSRFARRHPGGKLITFYGGRDATDAFHAFHAPATEQRTRALMSSLQIGLLQESGSIDTVDETVCVTPRGRDKGFIGSPSSVHRSVRRRVSDRTSSAHRRSASRQPHRAPSVEEYRAAHGTLSTGITPPIPLSVQFSTPCECALSMAGPAVVVSPTDAPPSPPDSVPNLTPAAAVPSPVIGEQRTDADSMVAEHAVFASSATPFPSSAPSISAVEGCTKPTTAATSPAGGAFRGAPPCAVLDTEFRALDAAAVAGGLYEASLPWYAAYFAHILVLEAAATGLLALWSSSWWAWVGAVVLLGTAQVQAGWLQHDFGHVSVFRSPRWNQAAHWFVIGTLKAASSSWWKMRHNRHHAATNVLRHDPDIDVSPVFLFGDQGRMPHRAWSLLPHQRAYWWMFGPPTVTTVIFLLQVAAQLLRTREAADIAAVAGFFVRMYVQFGLVCGMSVWQVVGLYFAFRLFESHWFTWITSMSHLPMHMALTPSTAEASWVRLHVASTQDVSGGAVVDWACGHLNYQIEHHLFPRMPRHNLRRVQPLVHALLRRHGIEPRQRSLVAALGDVLRSLDAATALWRVTHSHRRSPYVTKSQPDEGAGSMSTAGAAVPSAGLSR